LKFNKLVVFFNTCVKTLIVVYFETYSEREKISNCDLGAYSNYKTNKNMLTNPYILKIPPNYHIVFIIIISFKSSR